MDTLLIELIVIFLLICLNGLFSMSEFAIISIRKARIAQLVAEGDSRAAVIDSFQKDPHSLLAVIQIGVTVAGTAASTLGGITALQHLRPALAALPWQSVQQIAEPLSALIVVAVVSYTSLIIGELVPKALGLQHADIIALRIAKPMLFLQHLTAPVVLVLTSSSKAVQRILGIKREQSVFISREEVQHMVSEGHESGVFSESEHEYIRNVFEFTHTAVREVMVPRTRMVVLDLQMDRASQVGLILENQYSRYPVCNGDIEEIVGVLHDKDIMAALVKGSDLRLEKVIRPPVFVPESKKVNELLKEMQRHRNHMALVVDEYGGISGLVTTEDLLEELVGEIEDEHDTEVTPVLQQQEDGSWLADGLTPFFDLLEALQVKPDDTRQFETVAGLVLNELGHLPEQGESVEWNGYLLVSEQVTRTAILQVRIVPMSGQPDQPEEGPAT